MREYGVGRLREGRGIGVGNREGGDEEEGRGGGEEGVREGG